MTDDKPKPLSRRYAAFHSIWTYTADFGQYTEIILQDVPKLKCTLRLSVDNEERELRRQDSQTWALAQHLYVSHLLITDTMSCSFLYRDISPTSQLRVDIRMNSVYLPCIKKARASQEITLQKLFNDYWSSKAHEFALLG